MKTKTRLLAFLEENRGRDVSGEFLAGELGVSRTAVWKAVKELEKDGYVISAGRNRGYRLSEENDILSAQGIAAFFGASTEKILVYPSLESTNTTAKQLAISGAAHGTVVLADAQTAGRGRFGREFFSPRGCGVYMSFVLRPAQIMETPTLVTAFAAVAVCEAVEELSGETTRIKWVNDIFLRGKKICGISAEAVTNFESGEIDWVVLGIGINFREPDGGFPEEISRTAGAVFSEKPPVTRNQLAAAIIKKIAALNSTDWKIQSVEKNFLQKYRERLLFLGEKVVVRSAGFEFEATALDIDEIGRLRVRKPDGEEIALSSGEVSVKKA